jgi:carbon-monoxide dehydrogenase large subunit
VNPKGVGARLPRKEDRRFLLGQGEYVANIRLPGMLEVAFVRSPLAHARIKDIRKPPGEEASVFTAEDLQDLKPIRAVCALAGFKVSEQPILARDKVRQVGEIVAMCVAPTRAEAEDIADEVELSFEELPAVVDMLRARIEPPALVHEEWGDNVFLESLVEDDLGKATPEAAVAVTRSIRTARQHMSPMEGRGVVCEWNRRLEQLVMYSAAQMPHINRAGLAECLGIHQGAIRVIAPDVGGGFGTPAHCRAAW